MFSRKLRRVLVSGGLVLSLLVTAACSAREVDEDTAGARKVKGVGDLYYVCHFSTILYYTNKNNAEDEYEWFYPGGCAQDAAGNWDMAVISELPPAEPKNGPSGAPTNPQVPDSNSLDND